MDSKKSAGSMATGVLLVILGALFLMDNFGLLDFGDLVSNFWPLILILIGVIMIMKHRKAAEEKERT